jgi:hypothetical protein
MLDPDLAALLAEAASVRDRGREAQRDADAIMREALREAAAARATVLDTRETILASRQSLTEIRGLLRKAEAVLQSWPFG